MTAVQSVVDASDRLYLSALAYATYNWPVLPGPVSDGLAYWDPVTVAPLARTDPVVPARQASTDPATLRRWWARQPHSILAPAGVHFDVLGVPAVMAAAMAAPATPVSPARAEAIGRRPRVSALRAARCPVIMSPYGVGFLIRPGSRLLPELTGVHGVEILTAGARVVLPPSRVVSGTVRWLVSPVETGGRLGDGIAIQGALLRGSPP